MIHFSSRQQGFSLVELLVAMVLGLLLTAGALQMMVSSQTIFRTTDTLSRMQENGRFSLNFLAKSTRMAGHNTKEYKSQTFWDGACGATDPCTSNGAGNASDQIAVLLDPSNDSDCQGNNVGADTVIANVYSIDDLDNDQISSLYCRGFNVSANAWYSNAQPLVDGVENMQVLYGLSDPDASNVITSYISADGVTTWGDIGAIRISLLVNNGQVEGNGDNETRTFNLLDAPTFTATDRHSRQVFSTTVSINNVIYQSEGTNQ